jgi:DNA-binding beta-propeller fold protein YncE
MPEQKILNKTIKRRCHFSLLYILVLATTLIIQSATSVHAEILAMLNYETKPEQLIRKEGIAIIDVDPESPNFSKMLMDIPLPPDLVAHHIFYNNDQSKAYITALGKSVLHVMDMKRFPYRLKTVEISSCRVLEDMVFSEDNQTWYLTCMGSDNVIVGDAITDTPVKAIAAQFKVRYPHGINIHEGIDRLLVTSTVRDSDLGDPGEIITEIKASTGKVLSTHKVSMKSSPSGAAPVEILFVRSADPPVAYITTMYEGTLWKATWEAGRKAFNFKQVEDFVAQGQGIPLEMHINQKGDRLYVTAAKPGNLNIFDISNPQTPRFLKAIPTAPGSHHIALSPDERYAFVQNSLLNLPGMSDGSITVVDLFKGEAIASIDTLKNQGLNPNCIVLLPEWSKGHGH